MDILVLGGSYFLGKAFVHMAMEKHRVTVFNRGTRLTLLVAVLKSQFDVLAADDLTDPAPYAR